MQPTESERRRRRVQFVLLALLFMAPVVAAWVAWNYIGEHGVAQTTNAGELVVPARPIVTADLQNSSNGQPVAETLLHGHWSYLVVAPRGCDERCLRQVHDTRQIRISVNKDILRVQRLLVLGEQLPQEQRETLQTEHPDLQVLQVADRDSSVFLQQFSAAGYAVGGAVFFLIDPLGNLMMAYDPAVAASGVLKDLRKLLKISQVG